jgi:hypothetical protein
VPRRCRGAARARREARALAALLGGALVTYAAVALLPRPMASLAVTDARRGARGLPQPHERVGRHAAVGDRAVAPRVAPRRRLRRRYVTDHKRSPACARRALRNPARAGDGLVLLAGLEGYHRDLHVLFLGLAPEDSGRIRRQHLRGGPFAGRTPVGVATIPGPFLETVDAGMRDTTPWVRAAEVVDGAPRGLWQGDRARDALRARIGALGLVPVAATNHHGWGRAVVAWNLVRVPGWRALAPDTLGARLEDVLRRGDAAAVRVVARRRPAPGLSNVALALTAPALLVQLVRELTGVERAVWIAWVTALAALAAWRGRRGPRGG